MQFSTLFCTAVLVGFPIAAMVLRRRGRSPGALGDLAASAGALSILTIVACLLSERIANGELGPSAIVFAWKALGLVATGLFIWLVVLRAIAQWPRKASHEDVHGHLEELSKLGEGDWKKSA